MCVYLEGRLVDRIEMAQGAFPSRYQEQFFVYCQHKKRDLKLLLCFVFQLTNALPFLLDL